MWRSKQGFLKSTLFLSFFIIVNPKGEGGKREMPTLMSGSILCWYCLEYLYHGDNTKQTDF